MSKVFLETDIDISDIVHSLCSLSQEEILEFLTDLDETIGDWDFTRMARDYFVSEMQKVEHATEEE